MQISGHESFRQREGQKPCGDGSLPGISVKQGGQNIWRVLSKGEGVGDGIREVAPSQNTQTLERHVKA